MNKLIVLIICLMPVAVSAQLGGISGDVKDYTGKPYKGVHIVCLEKGIRLETDKHGSFSIQSLKPASYTLGFYTTDSTKVKTLKTIVSPDRQTQLRIRYKSDAINFEVEENPIKVYSAYPR